MAAPVIAVEILEFLGSFGFVILATVTLAAAEVIGVVIIYPIATGLRPIPFIGGNIADGLSAFWHSFTDNLQAQVDVQVKNLSDLIAFVSGSIQLFANAATTTAEWLGIQVDHAITFGENLAGDLGQQLGHLSSLLNQAAHDVGALAARVDTFIADVVTKIHDVVNKAIAQTEADIKHWADAEIRSVTDPISQAVNHFYAEVELDLQRETGRAQHMEGQLSGDIATAKKDVATDIANLRKILQGKIGNVEGTLEQELGDITDVIGKVAAGTTVVGLITTVATELDIMRRTCVDPTCGYMSPQLPVLNAIGDIATAAAFAAFIGAAVQNPKGASDAITGGVNALEGIFAPLFSGMAGIRL